MHTVLMFSSWQVNLTQKCLFALLRHRLRLLDYAQLARGRKAKIGYRGLPDLLLSRLMGSCLLDDSHVKLTEPIQFFN